MILAFSVFLTQVEESIGSIENISKVQVAFMHDCCATAKRETVNGVIFCKAFIEAVP